MPVLMLLAIAELSTRALNAGVPVAEQGAGIVEDGLVRADAELGWSMNPNVSLTTGFQGGSYQLATNSLGLRSPEVEDKAAGEYRILSRGESTTFGLGVDADQTYSQRLQGLLTEATGRSVTVVNAGHSAYSSTQSLIYLRGRGLDLKPDMILFYHEANDYMP
jgi:hypothetical protein